MTATQLLLRRRSLSAPIPEQARRGDLLQVEFYGQLVRNGQPGRIALLTDEWVKVVWE